MKLRAIQALAIFFLATCSFSFAQAPPNLPPVLDPSSAKNVAKPLTAAEKAKKENFTILAPKFEGAEAVYTEGAVLGIVRLTNVRYDDWGMTANVKMLSRFGGGSDSWEISSAWEVFSASADIWHATYVNFTIYFDKDLLAAVKSTAAQYSTQPDVLRTKIRSQLLDFQLKMAERLRSQAK